MIHQTTLSDFARRYTHDRELSTDYAATLRSRAAALELHCGHTPIAAVLTEEHLNAFMASLDRSPWTINKYRQDILTLWRAAADEDLLAAPNVRRCKRRKQPELLVECYSTEEARSLLTFAATMKGSYPNGVPRRLYWMAAIRCAWDTGVRRGDAWGTSRDGIRPDRSMVRIQHKTGRRIVCRLRLSTITAIEAAGGSLRWLLDKRSFSNHFQEIVRGSGVNRGSFKWLRRASGSYVEAQQSGAGAKHLGNTPGVFRAHYDAQLAGPALPSPPEL